MRIGNFIGQIAIIQLQGIFYTGTQTSEEKHIKGETRMNELIESKSDTAGETRSKEQQESKSGAEGFSRRTFLGVGSAGLASAALASLAVNAQERADIAKGEQDHSASNPARRTNRCWMKIRLQISRPSQITETSCPSGTPSICLTNALRKVVGPTR
jgi:hypothetical protein